MGSFNVSNDLGASSGGIHNFSLDLDIDTFGDVFGTAASASMPAHRKVDAFEVFMYHLSIYFTPVVITVGIVGNAMSFLVFTFTHLQRQSSSFYLSTLAVSDIGYLLTLLFVWLGRIGFQIFLSDSWCRIVHYSKQVWGFLSLWTILSFTAERYIIVYHPLRKDMFCTRTRAKQVVAGLSLFALLIYVYIFKIFIAVRFPQSAVCMIMPTYYDLSLIMDGLDTVIARVLPSSIIVVLNVSIIVKIHSFQNRRTTEANKRPVVTAPDYGCRRRSLVLTSVSTTGSMRIKFGSKVQTHPCTQETQELMLVAADKRQRVVHSRRHFRTARMLLILSSAVVLLNLPYHIIRVSINFEDLFLHRKTKRSKVTFTLAELFEFMYFMTFAINFFVYSACGRQFRAGLLRLTNKIKYKLLKCVIRLTANKDSLRYEA